MDNSLQHCSVLEVRSKIFIKNVALDMIRGYPVTSQCTEKSGTFLSTVLTVMIKFWLEDEDCILFQGLEEWRCKGEEKKGRQ